MYFFNVNALARDLRDEKLSEREKSKYYFGGLLIVEIILLLSGIGTKLLITKLFNLLGIIIFIIGFRICYKANERGDNKNFIERYACLSFPLFFIFMLFMLPLTIISTLAIQVFAHGSKEISDILTPLLFLGYLPIYYWILQNKIEFVAQKQSN